MADHLKEIDDIEARAKVLNLSLHGLCKRAKVDSSRIRKWRAGEMPNVRTVRGYVDKLSGELAKVETAILTSLKAVRDESHAPRA